ncbi:MAG: F0F1 ATP synthase subunit B [Calditrichia bacterium]
MLQLEPGMMIWTWVTFAVLFFVLAKVAWKPLTQAIEERENSISESLRKAEEANAKAQAQLEQQEKQLAETQLQIQKMLQESKEMAEKMKSEIVESGRQEAARLRERAQAEIAREKEAAIQELRGQVADLTIAAASRLISAELDDKKHRDLINQYIKEMDRLEKN